MRVGAILSVFNLVLPSGNKNVKVYDELTKAFLAHVIEECLLDVEQWEANLLLSNPYKEQFVGTQQTTGS